MKLTTDYLMTLDSQGVFDIIAWHLLNQNARAISCDGRCMYRAANGNRCAIGWVMPDDVYRLSNENLGVHDLLHTLVGTQYGRAFAAFLYRHISLLRTLQGVHDGNSPHDWPELLRMTACAYGLRATVVDHAMRPSFTFKVQTALGPLGGIDPLVPFATLHAQHVEEEGQHDDDPLILADDLADSDHVLA